MVRDEHAPEEAEIEEEIQLKRDDFVTRFDVRCDRMLEYFEKHYENKKPKLEEGEQKVEWSAVLDCAEQIRMAAPIWITFDQQDMETLEENSKAFCSLLRKLLELAWKYMAGVKALPTLFQCIQDSVRSAYRRGLLVMDMAIDTHDYEEMRGCTVKRVVALWHTLEYLMRVPRNNGDVIKSCLMRTTANMYDTMCEIKGLGVGKAYNCVSTLFSMMIRVIPTFIKLLDTNGDRNRMSNFEELLNLVILMESKFKITRSLLDPQHLDLDHDPGIGDALRLAYSAVQNIEKILAQIKEADLPVCEVQGDKVDASGRDAAGISTIGLSDVMVRRDDVGNDSFITASAHVSLDEFQTMDVEVTGEHADFKSEASTSLDIGVESCDGNKVDASGRDAAGISTIGLSDVEVRKDDIGNDSFKSASAHVYVDELKTKDVDAVKFKSEASTSLDIGVESCDGPRDSTPTVLKSEAGLEGNK